jgi:hypothetical protein
MKSYSECMTEAKIAIFGTSNPLPPATTKMWAAYKNGKAVLRKTKEEALEVSSNIEELDAVEPKRALAKYEKQLVEVQGYADQLWIKDFSRTIHFPGYLCDLQAFVNIAIGAGRRWEEIPGFLIELFDVMREAGYVHNSEI